MTAASASGRVEERSARRGEDQRGRRRPSTRRRGTARSPSARSRSAEARRAGSRTGRRGAVDATVGGAHPRQRHHEVAARDERLLVGGGDDLAGSQGREDRPEADDAAGPDDDEVDVVADRQRLEGVGAADALGAGGRSIAARPAGSARATARRTQAGRLLGERRGIGPGGQRDDLEGGGVRGEDVDRLAPDRAGRAEQRDPASRGRVALAVRRGRRRHTGSRPAPRTGTNRRGRASRRGPG